MKRELNFDTPYDFEVTKEIVGKVLLRVNAKKDDGAGGFDAAPIADLNKVQLQLDIQYPNGTTKNIIRGNLMDNLVALNTQSTTYDMVLASTANGYYHGINFAPFAKALRPGESLRVRVTVASAAYTNLVKAESSIEFRTYQVKAGTAALPVVRSYPIGKDKEFIDMELGNNVTRIVALTDLTKDYLTSTEAKLTIGNLKARDFNVSFDEPSLFYDNWYMLKGNPESAVQDLVIYQGKSLDDVNLEATLSKPALESAKILVVALEPA